MPPAQREPVQIPIRPIIINKPVVERTYVEGYRERIVERPTGDTEPLPAFVPPSMEQAQPPVIHVHVTQPTSTAGERTYEPPRVPSRDKSERTPDQPKLRTGMDPVAQIPSRPVSHQRPVGDPTTEKQFPEPNKKSSPEPLKTIPNNSPDRIDSELFEPDKPAPQASLPGFKKVGKVGRQRRYDELGIDDIEPIKEVVLFRYQMGRHWPGLSKDMEAYYEKMYFTKPKRGSKDAKHLKCWERRERWVCPTAPAGQETTTTP